MARLNVIKMRLAFVRHELDAFREYHRIARRSLNEAANQYGDDRKAEASKQFLNDEERNAYLELFADEYQEIRDTYPEYLAQSFVLMVYSFVEDELTRTCKRINRTHGYNFDFSATRDRGIVRAKKFLMNTHKAKLVNSDWKELESIGQIRNSLSHVGGYISQNKALLEVIPHIENFKDKGISLDTESYGSHSEDRAEIIIKDEYCYALLDFLSDFFERLYTKI